MTSRRKKLSDLQRDILEAIGEYTFLSTSQVYEVLGSTRLTHQRSIRRSLTSLERAGHITHGPMYEEHPNKRSGFAVRRYVYFLTPDGAKKLAELRTQITTEGIKVAKTPHYQRKPASLAHESAISEFHIRLVQALAGHPHIKLHWFQEDLKRGTNPDAVFGLQNTEKAKEQSTHWFFLEVELSRAGNWKDGESQKLRKAKRYDEYRQSREVTKDWPFIKDFRVVFQEETTERMLNLLTQFSRHLKYRFLWLTSRELVKDRGILDQIFYTPKDARAASHSFLQLLN